MAKTNQKNKKKVRRSVFQRIKSLKWYVKVVVIIALLAGGYQLYKFAIKSYDYAQFDKAEQQLRNISGIPKPDHTFFEQSCSYKSVKFGPKGKPNCNTSRFDLYKIDKHNTPSSLVYEYAITDKWSLNSANSDGRSHLEKALSGRTTENERTFEVERLDADLECYAYINLDSYEEVYNPKSLPLEDTNYLSIANHCYQKVEFQLYPEI